jgi:hypothetical protein
VKHDRHLHSKALDCKSKQQKTKTKQLIAFKAYKTAGRRASLVIEFFRQVRDVLGMSIINMRNGKDFKLNDMETLDKLSPGTISFLRQTLVPFEPYKVVLCRNINLKLICSTVIFCMNLHESVMDLETSF